MCNHANGLGLRRIAGSLGAEVTGVDLSGELDDHAIAAVRAGLLEHLVLVFREQSLDPGSLAALARRVGKLNRHPAMATMLYGTEIPPYGGDTLFADMRAAYRALSDGMKRMLDGLVAVFSNERTYGPDAARFKHGVKQMEVAQQNTVTRVEHPVVRTHPETGVKALYLNPLHTVRFKDMTARESPQPLIDYLCRHATRPEFLCRVQWRAGSPAHARARYAASALSRRPGVRGGSSRCTTSRGSRRRSSEESAARFLHPGTSGGIR